MWDFYLPERIVFILFLYLYTRLPLCTFSLKEQAENDSIAQPTYQKIADFTVYILFIIFHLLKGLITRV